MSAHVQQAGLATGRQMVMMATIALHALVIALAMTFTIRREATVEVPPLILTVPPLETTQPPPEPQRLKDPEIPSPGQPDLPQPRPVFPTVASTVAQQPVDASAWQVPEAPVASGGAGEVAVVPAPTELRYVAVKSTDDYYPATSLQLQEEGIAIVRVCVGADGRISGTPTVQTSSGSRRLDAAAVAWTREALRFTPATREGLAVPACKGFRVRFNLR